MRSKEKSGECNLGGWRGYDVIINVCVYRQVLVHVRLQSSVKLCAVDQQYDGEGSDIPAKAPKAVFKSDTDPIASVCGSVWYLEDIRLAGCLVFAGI